MSESHYVACAEVLSICQSFKEDLAAILDPQTGFAPRMREICQNQIEEYKDQPDSYTLQNEIEVLHLEENTWGLLQAVIPARKTELPPAPTAKELLLENPYTPTSTLVQAILRASPLLSELIVIREWLQETAPMPPPPEANTGYWKVTKHTIMQNMRTGHPKEGLVSDMDPDATNRGEGAALAGDDTSYEKSLLQALYGYIRAGRLDEAVEVCRRAHQPWRAASLRGSLLFQWKSLSTHQFEEDSDEDDMDAPEAWSGDRNRALWKSTCVRAALSSSLSDPERLLYAAIVPVPETMNILKASCITWEDHLWADISVMCEQKTSRELTRLAPGSFWEGGVEAVEKGADVLQNLHGDENEDEEWEQDVARSLDRLQNVAVADGLPADHAFHFSQLYIILNETDKLLDSYITSLTNGGHVDSFEYDSMCRFFAHFCLFLQMIDIPVSPQATQTILETYIGILEQAGQRELIALYAGALGDNAVERYAAFLVSLALTADLNERRLALTRASEHGLDIERVAIVTAERTIERAFVELQPKMKQPLPSIINLQPPPTEPEMLLLRSIEWTIFMQSTYPVALEQATVILRYFLGAGRVQAVHSLIPLLPDELTKIGQPEEVATEYLHYRQFFSIWDKLANVVEHQAQEGTIGLGGTGVAREAKAKWVADYRNLIDDAYDHIVKLLTTEWLIPGDEALTAPDNRRRLELIRIRQIYVPELILRMHYMLYASRKVIAENLKRTLEFANVVADSRYRLYDDFVSGGGRTLADYLGAVRQAVLAGLEHGGSDPFRTVSNF